MGILIKGKETRQLILPRFLMGMNHCNDCNQSMHCFRNPKYKRRDLVS
jgi:hypothetical protein